MSSLHRLLLPLAAVILIGLGASPAFAHGFTSNVYADVSAEADGRIRTMLELEYDLFVVSAADYRKDDGLFQEGTAAFEAGDTVAQGAALDAHAPAAVGYVTERFTVAAGGTACEPVQAGDFRMGTREGVPYTTLVLDWTCPEAGDHTVRSALFPESEQYVRDTRTVLRYTIDGRSGDTTLDAATPEFSTAGPWYRNPALGLIALPVVGLVLWRRSSVVRHQ